jgi:Centromere DNA-binding protein complex CBF3 subunit, domain 2
MKGWPGTSSAVSAYNDVFNDIGISPLKCTHVRRSGTEFASAQGELTTQEIVSMTKHSMPNQSTLEASYHTELSRRILECMAGFPRQRGQYSVPRTRIPIEELWPLGLDDLIVRLFPSYPTWVDQWKSELGDNSYAAENFLEGVIPFFAKVIAQDGCFWILKYPNHEVSILLRNVLGPEYVARAPTYLPTHPPTHLPTQPATRYSYSTPPFPTANPFVFVFLFSFLSTDPPLRVPCAMSHTTKNPNDFAAATTQNGILLLPSHVLVHSQPHCLFFLTLRRAAARLGSL